MITQQIVDDLITALRHTCDDVARLAATLTLPTPDELQRLSDAGVRGATTGRAAQRRMQRLRPMAQKKLRRVKYLL